MEFMDTQENRILKEQIKAMMCQIKLLENKINGFEARVPDKKHYVPSDIPKSSVQDFDFESFEQIKPLNFSSAKNKSSTTTTRTTTTTEKRIYPAYYKGVKPCKPACPLLQNVEDSRKDNQASVTIYFTPPNDVKKPSDTTTYPLVGILSKVNQKRQKSKYSHGNRDEGMTDSEEKVNLENKLQSFIGKSPIIIQNQTNFPA